MRRVAALLGALLLVACTAPTGDAEAQIRELEQAQARVAVSGDRAALEKIFAADFQLINPAGAVASREELLTLLASGQPPYRAASYVTERVLVSGDVVATTGTESVEFAATGEPQQRRITQVWRRQGDGWQLVLRQATLVAPPRRPDP